MPGTGDVAQWNSTVTAARNVVIGGNLSFAGIQITNPTGLQTISATNGSTLTLGSQGIDMSGASANLTISALMNMGADQTWNVAAGQTLTIQPGTYSNTGSATVTLTGTGSVLLGNGGNFFGTGSTVVLGGGITLGGANSVGSTVSNPVSLASNIGISSVSTSRYGGILFTGTVSLGSSNYTMNLSSTTSSATIPVVGFGSGTTTSLSGSGTLDLVNANPSQTPVTSVGIEGGVVQSGLEIGNGVTMFVNDNNYILTAYPLIVDAGGTFNSARTTAGLAFSQQVGALSGAGLITSNATTASTAYLTVDGGTNTSASTFSGQITNTAGATLALSKKGSTTQVLTGSSTYSGATYVYAGTLQLGSNASSATFLPSATAVYLDGGTLNLNFTSNAVCQSVGSLYINNSLQTSGIWGPVGSGATNTSPYITGTGLLLVGPVAPFITTQPVAQSVNSGSTATFSVTAAGNPAPTYQWQFNGTNLSGQTNSTLTLTNVTTANAGNYDVVVTNSSGNVTSNSVALNVNVPPTITTQPMAQTVNAGGNATFSVTATGTPAPTYQWQFNGANLPGQTSSTLTLTNVTTANAGNYDVVVTNVAGNVTSNAVALTVDVPPTITTQPVAQTVNSGGNATFSVTATGTPPPTYQWQFNGANLSSQTSSTLTLTNVTTANAGNYDVVVSNAAGNVPSNSVALTVYIPPVITTQPVAQNVILGDTATFSVAATGTPAPTYQWQFNGANLSSQTSSTLTLTNVTGANAGNYDVVISNPAGNVTSNSVALSVFSALITKANNLTALNIGTSWTGGAVPTSSQVASWNSTVTAARSVVIGGNLSFAGIQVTNPTGLQTISATSGSSLTLGTEGIDMSLASANLTIGATLNFASAQTFNVGTLATLTIGTASGVPNTGSATITLNGPGNVRFSDGTGYLGTGSVVIGGGINLGNANSTSESLTNPITLTSNIGVTSLSTIRTPGLSFAGNVAVGGNYTVTLYPSTNSAIVPVFGFGGGSASVVSGSGGLVLVNGNITQYPATAVAMQSGVQFETGLEIGNGVTVFTTNSNVINSGAPLTVDAGGTLNMAQTTAGYPYSQTVGSLSGAGLITSNATLTGNATLTVNGGSNTTTSTFSGQITNTGGANVGLLKLGSTTQVLTGSSTYSGYTTVNGGVLQLGNNSPSANFLPASTTLTLSGGTLNLSFTSFSVQQNVAALTINGVSETPGIYGPVGSGAQVETSAITGTGTLVVGVITSQPVGTTVYAGANVNFSVTALPSPTPTYQWQLNGTNIPGQTSSTLALTNVQLTNAGNYTVVVTSGSIMQTSATATLVVNQAPIITTQPVNVTIGDNLTVNFSAAATGYPAPTYQWQYNGVNISGATSSTLTMTNILASQAGTYSVVITNSFGQVTSSNATLVVNSSPYVVNVEVDPPAGEGASPDIYSWTFDQPVTRGNFIDGMPWIILPAGGANLVQVSPARQDNVTGLEGAEGVAEPGGYSIDMTVKNPPVGLWFTDIHGDYSTRPFFGWDSRGCTRSHPVGTGYSSGLSWDGSPMSLSIGDSITTAYSITGSIPPTGDTVLRSLAVLTVLQSAPPADAFRPGVVKSCTRRRSPQWYTLSQVINTTPYLIPEPTTDVYGKSLNGVMPSNWQGAYLASLMPGPSFMNSGTDLSRSINANYNNSNTSYGQYVMENIGDTAVGSLASWLTPAQRQACQIHFLQRAVDSYEALLAGMTYSLGGGELPGYGALFTVAGTLFNDPGMLSLNNETNGITVGTLTLPPLYYFSDHSQMSCLVNDVNVLGGVLREPPVGTARRIDFHGANLWLNLDQTSTNGGPIAPTVITATSNTFTVPSTYLWPPYRAPHEVINMKLQITSGTGAGPTIYTVTGITNYTSGSGGTGDLNDTEDSKAYGGTLTVSPHWASGSPDSTSQLTISAAAQSQMSAWAFSNQGLMFNPSNGTTKYNDYEMDLSPNADYSWINAGGCLTLYVAMYDLNAQTNYTAGMDQWMINIGTIPGYGEYLLSTSNARAVSDPIVATMPDDDHSFVGGLWKTVLTNPLVNQPLIYTDGGTDNLPVVPAGTKLWNEP